MRMFWRDIRKLTVIGFAVVGLLCLLGVTSFWAGIIGLLVLDAAVLMKLNRVGRKVQFRPLRRLGSRHMFLN